MPKATWSTDVGDSPWEDELDDFPIYDGPLPPKGVYRFALKRLQLTKNKNDDPMLKGLAIIDEPAGSKKSQYNGKDVWFNLNVTQQGRPWVNNFLTALVPENKVDATRKAFWGQKVMVDKSEPPTILSIGAIKIIEGMLISAQCGHKIYNGDTDLDAKRFLRPSNTDPSGAAEPADDDDDDWEDAEEETAEDETEEEPEGDDDEEFNQRAAELEAMDRSGLLKAAKAVGVAVKRGTAVDAIIDAILAEEFPPEDEEPEDEEEVEEEEPEEEPEPEPEPPARTRRTRAKPAAKAAESEPELARAKTGTRRRRVQGEPPF